MRENTDFFYLLVVPLQKEAVFVCKRDQFLLCFKSVPSLTQFVFPIFKKKKFRELANELKDYYEVLSIT
jgi:hypothetical protein